MNPKARFSGVSEDEKQTLRRYLQEAREALLLGLVKHCAAGECVYFGRAHAARGARRRRLEAALRQAGRHRPALR
jgi:hypothetical protein